MKHVKNFLRKGNIIPVSLVASAFVGFVTVMSLLLVPTVSITSTSMYLQPLQKTVVIGETFTVDVVINTTLPANVFAGELQFDTTTLEVASIDYNTSIADLWAEEPWYSNGAGTLNFIGGTTQKGGFAGTGTLITITFKAKAYGAGTLYIDNAHILHHNGLGTDLPLVAPLDAIFTIKATSTTTPGVNLLSEEVATSVYEIVRELPSTDLNGDGKQNISDVSILLLNIGTEDLRYDLNLDKVVDLKDFNIVLGAR